MSESLSEDALYREIVNQLVIATPEWWDFAYLTLQVTTGKGAESIQHTIANPSFPKDLVFATEELMLATRQLQLHHRAKGSPWVKAVFEIQQDSADRWNFKVNYTYE